jgi:hypothetical protein
MLRKKRPAFRAHSKRRKPGDAHTIPSFCESNAISESEYYKLKRDGKQPREIEVNKRIIITPEAEADWRREREAETMAKRQKAAAEREAETVATTTA